jgi:hypothetical protein
MMRKSWLAAAIVLVSAVIVASALGDFSRDAARSAAKATSNPKAVGIKVHGQWTLQVRTPAGRVVRTERFHNELLGGSSMLSRFLDRSESVGRWQIVLQGSDQPCISTQFSQPAVCLSTEPDAYSPDIGHAFKNLAISRLGPTGGETGIRLAGTVIADRDGTISQVYTEQLPCAGTVAPSNCQTVDTVIYGRAFTYRTLASSVDVLAGQQVLATVDLTFTSA